MLKVPSRKRLSVQNLLCVKASVCVCVKAALFKGWKPLACKPILGYIFCNLFLETLLGDVFLGTLLGNCFGTLAWEPCLGTCSWEPGLGIVPGNLACEPVPGKFDWKSCSWDGWKTPSLRCWEKTFPSKFPGRGSQAGIQEEVPKQG